jgi:RNA recognition motif-containing protein
MNIYVGNLSPDVTGDDLRQAFEAFGQVESANVITDKFSGESRGFGFVEMPSKDEATAALTGMNGKDIKGKAVSVNEARPRVERPRGGGGGGYGGGRSGDRGPRGGGGGGRRY